MKTKKILHIATLLGFYSLSATAALITDPALVSGAGIDPVGGQDVDESFGTAQATLEARADLRVIQDWTGFTTGGNVVNFTDNNIPDFEFSTNNSLSGRLETGVQLRTETSGNALAIEAEGVPNTTHIISFGTWDTGTSSFTGDRTVEAAGFVITNVMDERTISVDFLDDSGTGISGASFSLVGVSGYDGTGFHKDFYVGWDSVAEGSSAIGGVRIILDTGDFNSGFDDLAFTVIPEPSSLALAALALVSGLVLFRRRRYSE